MLKKGFYSRVIFTDFEHIFWRLVVHWNIAEISYRSMSIFQDGYCLNPNLIVKLKSVYLWEYYKELVIQNYISTVNLLCIVFFIKY